MTQKKDEYKAKESILRNILERITWFIIDKVKDFFLNPTPSSPMGTLLEYSRIIAYFGSVGGVISLWVMGYIADGFICILLLLLGNILYGVAYFVAQFLFVDTMSSGKIDEPISPRQVVAVASWQLYYMIVLTAWCDITIWGYLGDIECIKSMALRFTYLAIGISIPGLAILRQSIALRQRAHAGSKMALGMHLEFEVTFLAHVLACYAAYSGEKLIIALSIVPLLQVLCFAILISDIKEYSAEVVRELRTGRMKAVSGGKDDTGSASEGSAPSDTVEG